MVKDAETREDVEGAASAECEGDSTKRMKLEGIADGQDDNKSKMYQVSRHRSFLFASKII